MVESTQKQPGETVFGYLMLLLSTFLFWQAYQISGFEALSSPGAFPLAAAGIMVISSCIVVVKNARRQSPAHLVQGFFTRILPPLVAIMIALILIYAVVLDSLGFIPSTFVFLLLAIHLLHHRSIISSLVITTGSLILIYVIFRLVFQIILPEGIVPEREILAWLGNLFGSKGN